MKREPRPITQSTLYFRLLAGGYLLYTAWDIRGAVAENPLFLIAIVAFAIIGAALVGQAGWKLYKKDYEGGNPPEEPAENEEEPVA